MRKAHLWYVIGTGKAYWLDDERAPLECYRIDDEGLTPASLCYAKVVARWLEILASYAEKSNLTVIMSRTVLERLKTWRVALSPR